VKKIGVIDIGGTPHDVCLGTHKDTKNLGDAFGAYEAASCQIWVEEGMPKAKTEETLTHETLHAIWQIAGVNYATAASLGISADDPRIAIWEEMIVRVLTPHMKTVFGAPKVHK
jgi:hypothetical protein